MFTSYHVPLEERSRFPAGTYFAIMPRPLLRGTQPVAVVIPEPDPPENPSSNSSEGLSGTAEEPDTSGHHTADTLEAFRRNSDDFDLRKTRIERPFTIASPDLKELCRVELKSAESAHYVYASDGTLLARIHRKSGRITPWPRRAWWNLEVAHDDKPPSHYSAPQGTVRAWTSFVIFSPLLIALMLFRLLSNMIGLDDPDFAWDMPVRAKWRAGMFKWGLDYHGVGNTYYINTEVMDTRVAYAQAIIHSWTPRIERKSRS